MKNTAATTKRPMTLKTGVRAGITPIPIPGSVNLNLSGSVSLTSLSTAVSSGTLSTSRTGG
ncbi:MAG: hypothetical protein U0324_46785 [Polyangiales bacterium]